MIKVALAGTAPRQGLNHVIGLTPSDPTQWTLSKTKTELETLCLAEAGRRFTQVATTPFLQSPLLKLFTEASLATKVFDQVLAGNFVCPKGVDEMRRRLLSALQAVFNARLANLGFATGYLLKCWCTGLNIMLEKQAGNFTRTVAGSSHRTNIIA